MQTDPAATVSHFIDWITGVLWSALVVLLGIIWRRMNKDIDSKAPNSLLAALTEDMKNKASKNDLAAITLDPDDFVLHSDYEQNRREVREDIRQIHDKLDRVMIDMHTGNTNILTAIAGIKNGK